LALKEELSGLMDTSEVSSMLAKNLSRPPSVSPGAATFDREQLFASAENDSGGISSDQYVSEISSTQLSDYQIAKVKQTLGSSTGSGKGAARKENSRTREDIAIVFDQNKSALYSSYKRARRKNPGLKGKIVLEITIAPNGKVTKVKIISSELNDAKLEKRIVARIKTFDFGEKKVKTMTVTYPIEFLPS
jgi:TonB family protein